MRQLNRGIGALVAMAFLLALSAAVWGAEVNLRADAMRYDPNTKKVVATGNVHLKRMDGELFGYQGEGQIDGQRFILKGGVWGKFPQEQLSLKAEELVFMNTKKERVLEAYGDVDVIRSSDRLQASEIVWRLGEARQYQARGQVRGHFEKHEIEAEELGRDKEDFWGKSVTRYEDKKQGFRLSAQKVNGRILKEEVVELVAQGNLSMKVTGKEGKPIRITGKKGVYSRERGTVVVSGGARAVQESRIVEAENLVLHLDSMKIEALGSPKISFPVKD